MYSVSIELPTTALRCVSTMWCQLGADVDVDANKAMSTALKIVDIFLDTTEADDDTVELVSMRRQLVDASK